MLKYCDRTMAMEIGAMSDHGIRCQPPTSSICPPTRSRSVPRSWRLKRRKGDLNSKRDMKGLTPDELKWKRCRVGDRVAFSHQDFEFFGSVWQKSANSIDVDWDYAPWGNLATDKDFVITEERVDALEHVRSSFKEISKADYVSKCKHLPARRKTDLEVNQFEAPFGFRVGMPVRAKDCLARKQLNGQWGVLSNVAPKKRFDGESIIGDYQSYDLSQRHAVQDR